jgi:hypothetical protein
MATRAEFAPGRDRRLGHAGAVGGGAAGWCHREQEGAVGGSILRRRGCGAHHTGLAATVELGGGRRSDERWKQGPTLEAMEDSQDQWRPRNSDENEEEWGSPVTYADGEHGRTVELSLRTKWRRKNGVLDSYRAGLGRA